MEREEEKPRENEVQLVLFSLAGEEYGVEIHQVREIARMMEITEVPNAPEFISGIVNLRGRVIVVADLRKIFNLKPREAKRIVIAEIGRNVLGVVVDEVTGILKISEGDIRRAPGIIVEKIHADYLKGVAILGERMIILLDLEKVLSEEELVRLIEARTRTPREEKPRLMDAEVEERARKFEGKAEEG